LRLFFTSKSAAFVSGSATMFFALGRRVP